MGVEIVACARHRHRTRPGDDAFRQRIRPIDLRTRISVQRFTRGAPRKHDGEARNDSTAAARVHSSLPHGTEPPSRRLFRRLVRGRGGHTFGRARPSSPSRPMFGSQTWTVCETIFSIWYGSFA